MEGSVPGKLVLKICFREIMDIKKIFGDNLKKYRKSLGLTQEELAERVDVSPKHLSNIEMGTKFISAELLENLCKELDVPAHLLFYNKETAVVNPRLNEDPVAYFDKVIEEEMKIMVQSVKEKIRIRQYSSKNKE